MARYIKKIGVELELAIRLQNGSYPDVEKFRPVSDGSINSTGTSHSHTREYVSDPCSYKSDWDNEDMSELEAGIYQLYNNFDAETNDSMGTHVHMSFYKDYYRNAIASKDFIQYFEQNIAESELYEKYPRLQERLSGVNYAKKVNPSDLQRAMDNGGAVGSRRYKHFIYRQETVEFRVMPGFDTDKDVREAINLLTTIVNSYLYNKRHEFEETETISRDSNKPKIPEKQNLEKKDIEDVIQYV